MVLHEWPASVRVQLHLHKWLDAHLPLMQMESACIHQSFPRPSSRPSHGPLVASGVLLPFQPRGGRGEWDYCSGVGDGRGPKSLDLEVASSSFGGFLEDIS